MTRVRRRRTAVLLMLAGVTVGLLELGIYTESAYVQSLGRAAKANGSPTTMTTPDVVRYGLLMKLGFRGAMISGIVLFICLLSPAAAESDTRNERDFDVIQ